MFLPPHFSETDVRIVVDLVRSAGFGHLVVTSDEGLVSTPVPFVVADGLISARAHLARPNPVWRSAPCDALLIVPVSAAYISPSWYPSKRVDGRVVPTWNYEVVHLHGRLAAHDDADWVRRQVDDLTQVNEGHRPEPWAVSDAPDDYVAKLQRAIVGIELEVTRVNAKRKLSQNKPDDDVAGAIAGLRADGERAVAEAMRSTRTPS